MNTKERPGGGSRGAQSRQRGGGKLTSTTVPHRPPAGSDLDDYVQHFRARVLQDALIEACSHYWRRRADTFERVGNERCDAVAAACRARAAVSLWQTDVEPEVVDAVREAA